MRRVVQLSRHGAGHHRLSNQVDHKANLAALLACETNAVGLLHRLRLPGPGRCRRAPWWSSTTCTSPPTGCPTAPPAPGTTPPAAGARPLDLREALQRGRCASAGDAPRRADRSSSRRRAGYGHVDGPRFNTRPEVAALGRGRGGPPSARPRGRRSSCAGEAELRCALVGFVTDYANGVGPEPEPVQVLLVRMAAARRSSRRWPGTRCLP